MSCFLPNIFVIKTRRRRKTTKCKQLLALNFAERRPQLFYGRLLARFIVHFGKVWLSLFADLRLRSLAMKQNAEFTEGG